MPSDLLRRLSQMSSAPAQPKPAPKNPKLYEATFPVENGLFSLHRDALQRMGFTGDSFDITRAPVSYTHLTLPTMAVV